MSYGYTPWSISNHSSWPKRLLQTISGWNSVLSEDIVCYQTTQNSPDASCVRPVASHACTCQQGRHRLIKQEVILYSKTKSQHENLLSYISSHLWIYLHQWDSAALVRSSQWGCSIFQPDPLLGLPRHQSRPSPPLCAQHGCRPGADSGHGCSYLSWPETTARTYHRIGLPVSDGMNIMEVTWNCKACVCDLPFH